MKYRGTLNLGIWVGQKIVLEVRWKEKGVFGAEILIWFVITAGVFCADSCSLI